MTEKKETLRHELITLVLDFGKMFLRWLQPEASDKLTLKIVKAILKLPVAFFMLLVSPVLIAIVAVIFVVLI